MRLFSRFSGVHPLALVKVKFVIDKIKKWLRVGTTITELGEQVGCPLEAGLTMNIALKRIDTKSRDRYNVFLSSRN